MQKITTLNKAKQVKEGWQLIRNRKTLWCMLRETWRGQYKMSFYTTMVVITGLAYVFLPFDFDWIPLIGWVDDWFVIFLVIKRLQSETQRFIRFKAMERRR